MKKLGFLFNFLSLSLTAFVCSLSPFFCLNYIKKAEEEEGEKIGYNKIMINEALIPRMRQILTRCKMLPSGRNISIERERTILFFKLLSTVRKGTHR